MEMQAILDGLTAVVPRPQIAVAVGTVEQPGPTHEHFSSRYTQDKELCEANAGYAPRDMLSEGVAAGDPPVSFKLDQLLGRFL